MKVKNEVIGIRAFSNFRGVDSPNQARGGDTIGRIRNIPVENGLLEKLFHQILKILSENGLILRHGTTLDSTLIAAPLSTKNKDKNVIKMLIPLMKEISSTFAKKHMSE